MTRYGKERAIQYVAQWSATVRGKFGQTIPMACGKIRHISKSCAKRSIKAMVARGDDASRASPYWCGRCDAWHVATPRS